MQLLVAQQALMKQDAHRLRLLDTQVGLLVTPIKLEIGVAV